MIDIQGITKRALARALGVSEPTIHRWSKEGTLQKRIEGLQKEAEAMKAFEPIRELKQKRVKERG